MGTMIADHTLLSITAFVLVLALALLGLLVKRLRDRDRRATEAERLLNATIASIPDGFLVFDANDRLILCNDHLREMYAQISDHMVPGASRMDIARRLRESGTFAADDMNMLTQKIDAIGDDVGETELQLNDGRWVLYRDRKLPDGGRIGIRTDITEIKKREQALTVSAMRYRDMVERSPVCIYVHRDGIVLYANSATTKMLGYPSADDIVGKNIYALIHPGHHKLVMKRIARAEETEAPLAQADVTFMRFDGTEIYTEAQVGRVIFDGSPALETVLIDISQRQRTERALSESEQRYRNLFELSPDAILVHDGEHILFANEAAAQMLAAPTEASLFGGSIKDLVQDCGDNCALLASTKTDVQSCQIKRLNGEVFDAEVVVAPTKYHGQEAQQAVIRDVTERKRMDASMTQNAKLASLGSMAAGLAHELSQPLNIMRFAAEGGLLKMAKAPISAEQHAKNYTLIQSQSERMAAVMDNMRIFSRKDPGPLQPFDMPLAMRNISHLVRNPFRVDDVHIEIIGPVSGIMAFGNAVQFEQVMLNLLNNAKDSIIEHRLHSKEDEPGRITIECKAETKTDTAIITVQDNGGGIDEHIIGRIFDPFFTTKDVGQGTGLGLALSHEIITAMSGMMTAHNTKGGARFHIRLPLINVNTGAAAPSSDAQEEDSIVDIATRTEMRNPTTALPHILVVEDEVEAARALSEFLKDEGFKVSIAHDGREGLATYHAEHPDIIITDVRMPGMDGIALIQAVRADNADLPIIAVTGHMGDTEEIDAGPGVVPVKIMQKPVSLMELYRKIDEICAA